MKKLALSAVSALLAALFFGCAIGTPIVPLIPTESTAALTEIPAEVPTEAHIEVPTEVPKYIIDYNADKKTITIKGSSDYAEMVLPEEAFGTDCRSAFDAWKEYIMQTYPEP